MDNITFDILDTAFKMKHFKVIDLLRIVKVRYSHSLWGHVEEAIDVMNSHNYFEVDPTTRPIEVRLTPRTVDLYKEMKVEQDKEIKKEIEESEIRMLDILTKTNEVVDYPKIKKERIILFWVAIIELSIILIGLFSSSPK